ncbi:glycoside hydrolase family 2 TIM barrel-domain containing protein [uncultured Dysgonomonas sp.]|uniref:Glycosyl hydrolase family 2, sugar binding domain protein n=1 Tax=uncultured Dysgonomonas sp. TaxID=206096 RepID=A0A212JD48_9BACT|nr:glycoside hydrolase family 2 TIM barrel-domain containing protein [uncultured Dysgonomonas sp.]SBV97374.1 Glycosyl hydrolase family 2, sugar binding domain protein [uncultured Dysgonomonas sp.]
MNIKFKLFVISFLILACISDISASDRRISINKGWKFHRGSTSNAEQPAFNDTKWRTLDLPHDWSIEPVPVQREGITVGPFSKINESGAGGADTGQTLGGEGWYRKEFTIEKEDADKLFTLYFEGIYNQSEVWVNGKKVYFNPYGYTSFKTEITGYCNAPGIPNIIVVKAVNTGQNSRWYSGSGIYRNVWLIKTDKIHLNEWDTFIDASRLAGKDAEIRFSTIIRNRDMQSDSAKLKIKIVSPSGQEVSSTYYNAVLSAETPVSMSFNVKNPELWSVDKPMLYTAEVSVEANGKNYDHIKIPFGIRTISFSSEKGFLLNGKSIKLKGGCVHHDNGLLGAAAIDRAEEKKVELLKANGYNAVRCAHNQVSEQFLNACDRLGILVIHETFDQWQKPKREQDYHRFFDEWSDKDLAASVRRDRNHPSIIMWSIGNEIEQRADSVGEVIAKRLVNTIRQYDTSRYTTVGANDFWDRRQFSWDKDSHRAFDNVDIAGYNYVWWKYESDYRAYPDRIIYGSESYPKDAAQNWNLVEKHPYIIGDFVWTAIDYIGEAGLGHTLELSEGEHNPQFMGWPWYNAWCGDIDFCGDKKPQSYYRDILWRERKISMAVRPPVAPGKKEIVNGWGWTDELLSWNWKGMEGQTMRVNVYSRSPKVRLYLNDKLIGEKETDKENYTATFDVAYTPGILRAVNLDKNKETATSVLKTTGIPASIRLTADRETIKADKNDLSYVKIEIVDEDGDVIPDATLPVNIKCTGNGSVIAAGNAAYDDMKSFRSLNPNTFRGKAIAIIQPDESKGEINLSVSAEGLPESSIIIQAY